MFSQRWSDLPVQLSQPIQKAISVHLEYDLMTPVQAACIPQFINFKDVAVEAVTGSGKTIAFLVPLLEILISKCSKIEQWHSYALVISPTRELAIQISEVLKLLLTEIPQFSYQVFIGGNNPITDISNAMKNGINIIIATPGRLYDLLVRKECSKHLQNAFKHLEVLVLDEADRLLDLGFEKQLSEILAYCPKQRRTGLFSATQTADVKKLIRAGLRNPVSIVIKEKGSMLRTPQSLENSFITCPTEKKVDLLIHILSENMKLKQKVIVFFSTCAMVEYFTIIVRHFVSDCQVLSIHGKMRTKRNKMFTQFRNITTGVLLCTDLMARGIDIPDIDLVLQYDPPSSAEAFVHRCGRTARIGNNGIATILLCPNEVEYIQFIKSNQSVELAENQVPKNVSHLADQLRLLQMKDRDVMDKANKAFVSFVQSYAKHECQLIFQIKELNLGALASGMGLLRMPRMPELKNRSVEDFIEAKIDINGIPYMNSLKEESRLSKLNTYKETGKWPGMKQAKEKPWSQANQKRDRKKDQKVKRSLKKEAQKKRKQIDADDWDDMANETRLLKKMKKGKLSNVQFDHSIGID